MASEGFLLEYVNQKIGHILYIEVAQLFDCLKLSGTKKPDHHLGEWNCGVKAGRRQMSEGAYLTKHVHNVTKVQSLQTHTVYITHK